jgi:hypothetical protein
MRRSILADTALLYIIMILLEMLSLINMDKIKRTLSQLAMYSLCMMCSTVTADSNIITNPAIKHITCQNSHPFYQECVDLANDFIDQHIDDIIKLEGIYLCTHTIIGIHHFYFFYRIFIDKKTKKCYHIIFQVLVDDANMCQKVWIKRKKYDVEQSAKSTKEAQQMMQKENYNNYNDICANITKTAKVQVLKYTAHA